MLDRFCGSTSDAPSGGLLVKADYVSRRVAEPRSDFGRVCANRLHDLAPIGDDHLHGRGHAVDDDVNEKTGLCGGRGPVLPSAAYLAGRTVKDRTTTTTSPGGPAECPS